MMIERTIHGSLITTAEFFTGVHAVTFSSIFLKVLASFFREIGEPSEWRTTLNFLQKIAQNLPHTLLRLQSFAEGISGNDHGVN